jgi:magnesium-transporting ATPase (P-type)
MATAILRLGRKKALIQELTAVEILARVDTLLLDKTGTLTTGDMTCEDLILLHTNLSLPVSPQAALTALSQAEVNPNPSLMAIQRAHATTAHVAWPIITRVPFSSTRKWSAVSFETNGTWILGAPEIVLTEQQGPANIFDQVDMLASQGKRVLALAYSPDTLDATAELPTTLHPTALVVLAEQIRPDVQTTMQYFHDQGVQVKIISGDNPQTIQAVARAAGIEQRNEAYDARQLPDNAEDFLRVIRDHELFGRVSPAQKQRIVSVLQEQGHVVAMTGDGINDVLAIKQADFGISLGTGTAASRSVAQLILLNNDFAVLPAVIAEGRRVIANVERIANLFLTKTTYVCILVLAVAIAQVPFPFLPRHLTLIDFLTIGTPAIFLSFAQNMAPVRPGFISRVLRFTIPIGALTAAAALIVYAVTRQFVPVDVDAARTAASLMLIGCGFIVVILIAHIRSTWQWLCLALLPMTLLVILLTPFTQMFFRLASLPLAVWSVIFAIELSCGLLFYRIYRRFIHRQIEL